MDALSETSLNLDSFVPTDQVPLLAAYEPDEWAEGTKAVASQQLLQLRVYLAERLIAGPVEEFRDRISAILRDEHYHQLNSDLGAVLPAKALVNTVIEKKSGEFQVRDLGENSERYAHGVALQLHVLGSFLAFINSGVREPHRARQDKDVDRLSFMQRAMPVVIKRALLSMWIAPMLSVAVTAFGSTTPQSTKSVVLDQWIESLEQVLALFLAHGFRGAPIGDLAAEDLVPRERRLQLAQIWNKWKQGMARAVSSTDAMNRANEANS